MEKEIFKVINYFSFFNYLPSFEEIYTFLKKKTAKKHLASILENMAKKKVIKRSKNGNLYTLPQYSKRIQNSEFRIQNSKKKIQKIQRYIKLLSLFPQIKLVGLSGTVAMMNADEDDDIDLFIITARNRLFTGRFIAILLTQLFNLRRKRQDDNVTDKICLNLFFDERALKVPNFKKTEYVAHEVLQMKPLVIRGDVYQRFLRANRWVFNIFPNSEFRVHSSELNSKLRILNSKSILNSTFLILNLLSGWLEAIFKKFQLFFIRKHQTKEIITDRQLWFHPEDFGEKVGKAFHQVCSKEHQDIIF